MKRNILCTLVMMALLFIGEMVNAQGTVYLSNLSATSTGSYSIASNSWFAAGFRTGSNSGGYLLNSVQLAMLDATGNPNGFNVILCLQGGHFAALPGSSLGTLSGSTDPQSADIYTFIAPPSLLLLPNTDYYIVLSAGTPTADGAYQESTTDISPNYPGTGWQWGSTLFSSGGISGPWGPAAYHLQFSLIATPIPEPSTLSLLAIIGLPAFLLRRRYAKNL